MVNNHSLVFAQFYFPQLALVVKELFLQRMNRPVAVTNNGASFTGGVNDSHLLFCPEALLQENCQHASIINRETKDEIDELLHCPFFVKRAAFAVAVASTVDSRVLDVDRGTNTGLCRLLGVGIAALGCRN